MPTPEEIEKMIAPKSFDSEDRPSGGRNKGSLIFIIVVVIGLAAGAWLFLRNSDSINLDAVKNILPTDDKPAADDGNGEQADNNAIGNQAGDEEQKIDLSSLTACGQTGNFADFNSDLGLAADNSLLAVNYDTVSRYTVKDGECDQLWTKQYMSDDQQLVVQGDVLWVTSRSHDAIGKFNLSNGKPLNFTAAGVSMPRGLFPKDNTLYVTEFEGSIKVYDKESGGQPLKTITVDGLSKIDYYFGITSNPNLYDLVIDDAGRIYLLYSQNNVEAGQAVALLSADGKLINSDFLSTTGSASLYTDAENNFYLMDSDDSMELQVYNYVNNQPVPSGQTTQQAVSNLIKKYSSDGLLLQTWRADEGFAVSSFTLRGDKIIAATVKYDGSGVSMIKIFDN